MSVKFSLEEIEDVIFEGNIGFCISCGCEAYGVEPDAENYKCESCGEYKVVGAEQLLVLGLVE
jgi:hypothetical protein